MMAVWGLTGLEKPMIPMYEPIYDLRVIMESMRATLAIEEISLSTLPAIAMSSPSLGQLVEFLNGLPPPAP